jgi:hypothetical protein
MAGREQAQSPVTPRQFGDGSGKVILARVALHRRI